MAWGSIVTRNRNIVLRASVPALVGIAAAQFVLPVTSRNVGDLIWTYEERYPALAEVHIRTRERVRQFVETGKAHAGMTAGMAQDKLAGHTGERRGVDAEGPLRGNEAAWHGVRRAGCSSASEACVDCTVARGRQLPR